MQQPGKTTEQAEVAGAGLSVAEALRRYVAVVTAAMLVRALAGRIDDEGRLLIEGSSADGISIVALALDDVMDSGDGGGT